MSTLRKALGADPPEGYIETVARAGYRLTVPVRLLSEADPSPQARGGLLMADARPLAVRAFSTGDLAEDDIYLGVGIADAVTTALGGLPGLTVWPVGAVDDLAGARDAGVGHMLEGAVRRQAKELHVSARLIDVASGRTQWNEHFERPQADSVAVQDAIAGRVASSLAHSSAVEHAGLHSYRPRSPEAYFLQLQARASLKLHARLPALKALGLFEQALALDPNYATAHAGVASTYLLLTSTVILRPLPVDEAMPLARQSAERARAHDEALAEAWAVLGRVKMEYDWDWDGAEADLAHAVALNPNSVDTLDAYGQFLSTMGCHDEALEAVERARRLDPRRLETLVTLAIVCWIAGETERALAVLNDASMFAPYTGRALLGGIFILDQLGRHDQAMADRLAWLKRQASTQGFAERLTELERRKGWRPAMIEWLAMLERTNRWTGAAMQWMAIDEPVRALDSLERCMAERTSYLGLVLQSPSFHALQGEPRFQRIAQTLKLDGRIRAVAN
jgi:TolB-like protein/tetratricopeptide (TPR) repeat protein